MTLDVQDGAVRLQPEDWHDVVSEGTVPAILADVPGVAEAIAATREPVVTVQVDVAGEAAALRHVCWVGHEAVAMLAQVHDAGHQLIVMPPSLLAGGIARVVRLGPHQVADREPRAVDVELLDDLFHGDQLRRASAYQMLGAQLAWIVAAEGDVGERRLAVLRTGDGLWLVEPDDEGGSSPRRRRPCCGDG